MLLLATVVFLIVDIVLLSIFTSIPATRQVAQLEIVRRMLIYVLHS